MFEILSLIFGGAFRLFPEAISLFKKSMENRHELALADKQIQLSNLDLEIKSKEIDRDIETKKLDIDISELNALSESLKGQMKLTGIKVVDALTFSFRPVSSYLILFFYIAYKICLFTVAVNELGLSTKTFLTLYTDWDIRVFGFILSYWYVSRTLDKRQTL